jgi:hypothetical protein
LGKDRVDGAKGSFLKVSGAAATYNSVNECREQNYGVVCKERKE